MSPSHSETGRTASVARRLGWISAGMISGVLMTICAVMTVTGSQHERAQVHEQAELKVEAVARSLDAMDAAAHELTDRFYQTFASAYAGPFTLEAASATLNHQGKPINGDFSQVDQFNRATGGVATVFARKGDDFLRVSTSLKKENGERAIGTLLGDKHPARAAMLAGQVYSGRAVLFGRPYMTRYQPVKDAAGQVVGILFIGFDLSQLQASLEKMVAEARLFDSGGLLIIDPKAADAEALFVAHPAARGKKVTEARPEAAASLAALRSARDGEPVALKAGTLLAAGADRWALRRQAGIGKWWVVAEVADGEAMAAHYRSGWTYAALFALAAVVSSALLAWLVRRWVGQPLGVLGEQLAQVAEGNLTQAIHSGRRDEIGRLALQADAMRQRLSATIAQVRGAAESIQTASAEVAAGNADLSQRTEQAAANLQQTASSIEQLTGNVRQSADAAAQANQLAASAQSVAQRGGEVVAQVVSTMDEINASSKRIADIIGTIDGIAFQTNILALNAAVEAARAGEQGRGFAVVAGEVRSLAQRSAEAAREIKGLIGTSVDKVEAGARLVQDAGSTMTEIVGSVQRVTDVIGEITAAASEQSSSIGDVNGAIGSLDQMTQQNAALVEQSAAAAASLKQQAERLYDAVGVFRLADGSGGAGLGTTGSLGSPGNPGGAWPSSSAASTPARSAHAAGHGAQGHDLPARPAARPALPSPAQAAQDAVSQARDTSRQLTKPAATASTDDWETF